MDYDPFDPDTHAHPDEHFAALRDHCPVHHHAERDFYTVARTDDITTILRTPGAVVEPLPQRARLPPAAGEPMLLDADPPTHTWQRRLLQKAWTPRLIDRLEGRVQRPRRRPARSRRARPAGATSTRCRGRPAAGDHDRRAGRRAHRGPRPLLAPGRARASRRRAEHRAPRRPRRSPRVSSRSTSASHIADRRRRMVAGEPVPDDYTTMMLTATHDGRAASPTTKPTRCCSCC